MNKQIDYEKVQKINDAINKIWKRIHKIDKNIKDSIPFQNHIQHSLASNEMEMIIERKRIDGLLDERKKLFETLEKDLLELKVCYKEVGL